MIRHLGHTLVLAVAGFVSLALQVLPAGAITTSFHIGNSLTYDSKPLALEGFGSQRGFTHQVGQHIKGSSSLETIWELPNTYSEDLTSFGSFATALPGYDWDAVVLQPYGAQDATLGTEVDAFLNFINLTRSNPANQDTVFYVYEAWPQYGNYLSTWTAPTPDDPNHFFVRTRDNYHHFIERVRAETDAQVFMVPVGEVLYELAVRIANGEMPNYFTVNSFYRDGLHLDGGTGQFIAGVTTFATVLGQYPLELAKPAGFYLPTTDFTPVETEFVLEVIRGVLDQHPYTGVSMPAPLRADFDANDTVDNLDLNMLTASLYKNNVADIDHDGDVDPIDLQLLLQNWQPVIPPQVLAIADLNGDGNLNQLDIDVWATAYGTDDGADLDNDGDTDGRDFLQWQRAVTGNDADLNGDFRVDGLDEQILLANLGYDIDTDANSDGQIDNSDLTIWELENGRIWTFPYAVTSPLTASYSSAQLAVPEPQLAILFGFVAFGGHLLVRQRFP